MTLRVPKSILPADYAEQVEAHRQELLAHRFVGDAAPTAPALVEQAIRRVQSEGNPDDFVTDYEVIDDTPPPPPPPSPSAAELKAEALSRLHIAESQALDAVITSGKFRLLTMQPERADELQSVIAKRNAISLHFAKQEAELDDLTSDQYADWKPAPFAG